MSILKNKQPMQTNANKVNLVIAKSKFNISETKIQWIVDRLNYYGIEYFAYMHRVDNSQIKKFDQIQKNRNEDHKNAKKLNSILDEYGIKRGNLLVNEIKPNGKVVKSIYFDNISLPKKITIKIDGKSISIRFVGGIKKIIEGLIEFRDFYYIGEKKRHRGKSSEIQFREQVILDLFLYLFTDFPMGRVADKIDKTKISLISQLLFLVTGKELSYKDCYPVLKKYYSIPKGKKKS